MLRRPVCPHKPVSEIFPYLPMSEFLKRAVIDRDSPHSPAMGERRCKQLAKASRNLTAKQLIAINAILTGASDTDAAKAAGVHRMTISDWRNNNPVFIQELNRLHNEARRKAVEPYHKRLDELIDISILTLSNAIKRGDSVSARWLLDKVNLFPSAISEKFTEAVELPEAKPTDIDDIIDDIAERAIMEVWKEDGKSDFDVTLDSETFNKLKREVATSIKEQYQNEEEE